MPKVKPGGGLYDLNTNFTDRQLENAYTSAGDLVTWLRMEGTTGPVELGPNPNNDLVSSYETSPAGITSALIGFKPYSAIICRDSLPQSVEIEDTSSTGILSFSDAANLDPPLVTDDKPFSISMWVKPDHLGIINNQQYLVSKAHDPGSQAEEFEYRAKIGNPLGNIVFEIKDMSNGGKRWTRTWGPGPDPVGPLEPNKWYHVVCTYDGRGDDDAQLGLTVYINGEHHETVPGKTGTYFGMQPAYAKPLWVGSRENGAHEFDGQILEFAMWGKALSAAEARAIYRVTKTGGEKTTLYSGILNNPPRTIIRAWDAATGSYPTIQRTNPGGRSGAYKIHFDDTNTVVFDDSFATGRIDFLHKDFIKWGNDARITLYDSTGPISVLPPFRGEHTQKNDFHVDTLNPSGLDPIAVNATYEFAIIKDAEVGQSTITASNPPIELYPVAGGICDVWKCPETPGSLPIEGGTGPYTVEYELSFDAYADYSDPHNVAPAQFTWTRKVTGPNPADTDISPVHTQSMSLQDNFERLVDDSGAQPADETGLLVRWPEETAGATAAGYPSLSSAIWTINCTGPGQFVVRKNNSEEWPGATFHLNNNDYRFEPDLAVGQPDTGLRTYWDTSAGHGANTLTHLWPEIESPWGPGLTGYQPEGPSAWINGDSWSVRVQPAKSETFEFHRRGPLKSDNTVIDCRGDKKPVSVEDITEKFIAAVNNSDLDISAKYDKDRIALRQKTPGNNGNLPIYASQGGYEGQGRSTSDVLKMSDSSMFHVSGPRTLTGSFSGGDNDYTARYPTLLHPDSNWTTHRIASPHLPSDLTAPAVTRKGIADHGLTFSPGENLGPFTDSSVNINNDDEFFDEGTSESQIEGFSSPLKSKTQIVIEMPVITPSTIGYDGNVRGPSAGSRFRNMAYYNHETMAWEPIGRGVNIDADDPTVPLPYDSDKKYHEEFFEDACIGFGRGIEMLESAPSMASLPINNFGFPMHSKFDATDAQTISMSDFISHPFVLEKFTLEFDVAWSEGTVWNKSSVMYNEVPDGEIKRDDGAGNYNNKAAIQNFFILNQRPWTGLYEYSTEIHNVSTGSNETSPSWNDGDSLIMSGALGATTFCYPDQCDNPNTFDSPYALVSVGADQGDPKTRDFVLGTQPGHTAHFTIKPANPLSPEDCCEYEDQGYDYEQHLFVKFVEYGHWSDFDDDPLLAGPDLQVEWEPGIPNGESPCKDEEDCGTLVIKYCGATGTAGGEFGGLVDCPGYTGHFYEPLESEPYCGALGPGCATGPSGPWNSPAANEIEVLVHKDPAFGLNNYVGLKGTFQVRLAENDRLCSGNGACTKEIYPKNGDILSQLFSNGGLTGSMLDASATDGDILTIEFDGTNSGGIFDTGVIPDEGGVFLTVALDNASGGVASQKSALVEGSLMFPDLMSFADGHLRVHCESQSNVVNHIAPLRFNIGAGAQCDCLDPGPGWLTVLDCAEPFVPYPGTTGCGAGGTGLGTAPQAPSAPALGRMTILYNISQSAGGGQFEISFPPNSDCDWSNATFSGGDANGNWNNTAWGQSGPGMPVTIQGFDLAGGFVPAGAGDLLIFDNITGYTGGAHFTGTPIMSDTVGNSMGSADCDVPLRFNEGDAAETFCLGPDYDDYIMGCTAATFLEVKQAINAATNETGLNSVVKMEYHNSLDSETFTGPSSLNPVSSGEGEDEGSLRVRLSCDIDNTGVIFFSEDYDCCTYPGDDDDNVAIASEQMLTLAFERLPDNTGAVATAIWYPGGCNTFASVYGAQFACDCPDTYQGRLMHITLQADSVTGDWPTIEDVNDAVIAAAQPNGAGTLQMGFDIANETDPFEICGPTGILGENEVRCAVLSCDYNVDIEEGDCQLITLIAPGRELVSYGQVTTYADIVGSAIDINETLNAGLARELTIPATDKFGAIHDGNAETAMAMTGSFVMQGTCKSPVRHSAGPAYQIGTSASGATALGRISFQTSHPGTRNGLDSSLQSSRGLASTVPGSKLLSSVRDLGDAHAGYGSTNSFSLDVFDPIRDDSPYILSPGDKLVFGWQVGQPYWARRAAGGYPGGLTSLGPHMTLGPSGSTSSPSQFKLTLYGSLIKDGKEYHEPLNQPLTSDAIHEALHYDNPTVDQFDTDSIENLAGTMKDELYGGDIFSYGPYASTHALVFQGYESVSEFNPTTTRNALYIESHIAGSGASASNTVETISAVGYLTQSPIEVIDFGATAGGISTPNEPVDPNGVNNFGSWISNPDSKIREYDYTFGAGTTGAEVDPNVNQESLAYSNQRLLHFKSSYSAIRHITYTEKLTKSSRIVMCYTPGVSGGGNGYTASWLLAPSTEYAEEPQASQDEQLHVQISFDVEDDDSWESVYVLPIRQGGHPFVEQSIPVLYPGQPYYVRIAQLKNSGSTFDHYVFAYIKIYEPEYTSDRSNKAHSGTNTALGGTGLFSERPSNEEWVIPIAPIMEAWRKNANVDDAPEYLDKSHIQTLGGAGSPGCGYSPGVDIGEVGGFDLSGLADPTAVGSVTPAGSGLTGGEINYRTGDMDLQYDAVLREQRPRFTRTEGYHDLSNYRIGCVNQSTIATDATVATGYYIADPTISYVPAGPTAQGATGPANVYDDNDWPRPCGDEPRQGEYTGDFAVFAIKMSAGTNTVPSTMGIGYPMENGWWSPACTGDGGLGGTSPGPGSYVGASGAYMRPLMSIHDRDQDTIMPGGGTCMLRFGKDSGGWPILSIPNPQFAPVGSFADNNPEVLNQTFTIVLTDDFIEPDTMLPRDNPVGSDGRENQFYSSTWCHSPEWVPTTVLGQSLLGATGGGYGMYQVNSAHLLNNPIFVPLGACIDLEKWAGHAGWTPRYGCQAYYSSERQAQALHNAIISYNNTMLRGVAYANTAPGSCWGTSATGGHPGGVLMVSGDPMGGTSFGNPWSEMATLSRDTQNSNIVWACTPNYSAIDPDTIDGDAFYDGMGFSDNWGLTLGTSPKPSKVFCYDVKIVADEYGVKNIVVFESWYGGVGGNQTINFLSKHAAREEKARLGYWDFTYSELSLPQPYSLWKADAWEYVQVTAGPQSINYGATAHCDDDWPKLDWDRSFEGFVFSSPFTGGAFSTNTTLPGNPFTDGNPYMGGGWTSPAITVTGLLEPPGLSFTAWGESDRPGFSQRLTAATTRQIYGLSPASFFAPTNTGAIVAGRDPWTTENIEDFSVISTGVTCASYIDIHVKPNEDPEAVWPFPDDPTDPPLPFQGQRFDEDFTFRIYFNDYGDQYMAYVTDPIHPGGATSNPIGATGGIVLADTGGTIDPQFDGGVYVVDNSLGTGEAYAPPMADDEPLSLGKIVARFVTAMGDAQTRIRIDDAVGIGIPGTAGWANLGKIRAWLRLRFEDAGGKLKITDAAANTTVTVVASDNSILSELIDVGVEVPGDQFVQGLIYHEKTRQVLARFSQTGMLPYTGIPMPGPGEQGSFYRNLKLTGIGLGSERFFDTMTPSPAAYHKARGKTLAQIYGSHLVVGQPKPSDNGAIGPETTKIICNAEKIELRNHSSMKYVSASLMGCWFTIYDGDANAYNIQYNVTGRGGSVSEDGVLISETGAPPPPPTEPPGNLILVDLELGSDAIRVAATTSDVLRNLPQFIVNYTDGDKHFIIQNVKDGSAPDASFPGIEGVLLNSGECAGGAPGCAGASRDGRGRNDVGGYVTNNGGWTIEVLQPGVDAYPKLLKPAIDDNWLGAFPFEGEYDQLTREVFVKDETDWEVVHAPDLLANIAPSGHLGSSHPDGTFSTMFVTGSVFGYGSNPGESMPTPWDGYFENTKSYGAQGFISDKDGNINIERSEETLSNVYKFYFGSGRGWQNSPSLTQVSTWRYVPNIRGWKYGLMSALPLNTTSVFKRNAFGQFRDMLEQRLDAKFQKETQWSYINTETGKWVTSQDPSPSVSPISINFSIPTDSDGAQDPQSKNLSKTAKSSTPYFDRDRDPTDDSE